MPAAASPAAGIGGAAASARLARGGDPPPHPPTIRKTSNISNISNDLGHPEPNPQSLYQGFRALKKGYNAFQRLAMPL